MLRTQLRAAARPTLCRPLATPTTPARFLATATPPAASRFRSFLYSSALVLGTGAFLVYAHDSRAGVHRWVLPAIMALTASDPEKAHEMAVDFLASGIAPVDCGVDDEALAIEVWGKKFNNPVGMAAGWDKHAAAIDGLFNLGFGYVEIGSVTPEPQPGNPKPRLFRLPEIESVINRYGFNSEGHKAVLARLRNRVRQFVSQYASQLPPTIFPPPPPHAGPDYDVVAQLLTSPAGSDALVADSIGLPRSLGAGRVLGVNLGKNKTSDPDSIDDFVAGVKTLGPYADVLVINVSSPNTPGLRSLQRKGMLSELLEGVVSARNALSGSVKPPVLVKIAPDNDEEQLLDIAHAVTTSGVDGIIVSNTTISRPVNPDLPILAETGGLSGPPVKPLALKALATLYEATDGKVPLVGCGGIASGQDAVEFAKAGASLVQTYTSFIYNGVGLPRKIKDEVTAILAKEKTTWAKLIGTGRPVKAAPAVQEVLVVEGKPVASEKDFEASLSEAKGELETLLTQLAAYETPLPAPVAESATPLPDSTPVAVPSFVAESLATPADSLTTPTPAPSPAAEAIPSPAQAVPSPSPSPAADLPSIPVHSPKIDESPLAVPAQALLDEKAIAVLLDPAAEQVKAGVVEEKKKAEEPKVVGEGKRWV